MIKRTTIWKLCCLGVFLLAVLTFTPLVIPSERYEPMLMGLPRTLWAGILVYLALTVLTWIGSRVYRGEETQEGEDRS